jgi:preprotein translocase subunit SecY
MLQTLRNAWKTVDIRKKLLYTLFIILLYRIGTVVPVPFVNAASWQSQMGSATFGGGTILAYLDNLSGGALQQATLFALGISPYITASIVIQLLTVAIPALERLAQQGEEGKKKINNLTRYTTVILSVVTAIGYYFLLKGYGMFANSEGSTVLGAFVIITCFCAGASIVMWLGEKINEHGIGNGISIILFANIISGLPAKIIRLVNLVILGFKGGEFATLNGSLAIVCAVGYVLLLIAMVVFCVFVTGSERRISVQYAKRVVGRKMYGGQSQNLPLKLNMSGVMPVIFASSIISLPATIMAFCGVGIADSWANVHGFWEGFNYILRSDGWVYPVLLFVLIIAFSYFYVQISFNPVEVANNLKKNGGTILGCRPGAPTADYIRKSLSKITLIGAFFLSIVAIVPIVLVPTVMEPLATNILAAAGQSSSLVSYFTSSFAFGGTSLLIVVGVALELVRDIEAQLAMRSYKGFLN